jgi:hypothetical protein
MASRLAETDKAPAAQINRAFQLALGRPPTEQELKKCVAHFQQMRKLHQTNPPVPTHPPTYVVREMVEEMTGLKFYWVEDLDVYAGDYQPDLKPWDVSPEVRALADVCLVLFNSNEFVYVY